MESLGKEFDLDGNQVCECDMCGKFDCHYFYILSHTFGELPENCPLISSELPVLRNSWTNSVVYSFLIDGFCFNMYTFQSFRMDLTCSPHAWQIINLIDTVDKESYFVLTS